MEKLVNGVVVEMTADEIAARQADEAAAATDAAAKAYRIKREAAYLAKGWSSPFDLLDDVFTRGLAAVKADRDAIKTQFPKGQ